MESISDMSESNEQSQMSSYDSAGKYLEYIRVLHKRLSDSRTKSGLTLFTLVGVLVAIAGSTLKVLTELNLNRTSVLPVIQYFSYIHIIILSLIILLLVTNKSRLRSYDYRIYDNGKPTNIVLSITFNALFIALPGLAAVYILSSDSDIVWSSASITQLKINEWLLLPLSVVFLVVDFVRIWYQKSKNLPLPITLPRVESGWVKYYTKVLDYLGLIALVGLLIGNIYALSDSYLHLKYGNPEQQIRLAFNVSLSLYIVLILRNLTHHGRSLIALENIERDIVMHDIDGAEAKRRLEDEYLGRQLGDWIITEFQEIREMADQWLEILEGLNMDLAELKQRVVEKKLTKPEFEAQINLAENKYKQPLDAYHLRVKRLIKWFRAIASNPTLNSDKYLMGIVDENATRFLTLVTDMGERYREIIDKMKTN